MDLPQSTEAIAVCADHLRHTKSFGTEIEAYLVRYLLVVICAELEASILKMVVERAKRTGDQEISAFVDSTVERMFRRLRTGEMAGLLKKFDVAKGDAFTAKVGNTAEQVAFNNIVDNRHDMAHSRATVNLTFTELCDSFAKCSLVLDHFARELGLTTATKDTNTVAPSS